MGLNTWAAFTVTQEDAVIAGDVAMLDNEVTSDAFALSHYGSLQTGRPNYLYMENLILLIRHIIYAVFLS